VAIAKMEDLHTGTTLGEAEMPPMKFPTPMVGLAVSPKSRNDEAKLSALAAQDRRGGFDVPARPRFADQGARHDRHERAAPADHPRAAARRDKLDVDTKQPKIPFRETIQANAEGELPPQEAVGGRGQFGEVHIRMYPFPRGHQARGVLHQGGSRR
jgi:elongation factor G